MALNFPLNPTVGQQYNYPPYVYEWDGAKWQTLSAGSDTSQVLRDDLAADTGATLVGTFTGQTVQYELDNHIHTPTEVGSLPVDGTAVAAARLSAQRSIALTGDVTGSVMFDGSANVSITATVVDDLHNHTIANVDNLQTTLDGKLSTTGNAATASSAAKLTTARTITLTGDATSTAISFDGSANISIPVTVVDDLHNHTIANVDNLQTTLDGKLSTTGNAATASSAAKLTTARTISLTGDATGSVSFDGTANVSITAVIADDSHNHIIANVDNLQSTLDAKVDIAGETLTGTLTGRAPTPVSTLTALTGSTGAFSGTTGMATNGAVSYMEYLHGRSQTSGLGYITHLSIGSKHNGSSGWQPVYLAVGGSDASPTAEYLFYVDNLYAPGSSNFSDVYIRSDIRLKSDLVKLDSALDKVNKLTGYTYDKKSDLTSKDTNREVGLIAQDLQKVLPEAINKSNTDDELLSISNSGVNALLVEAIKELTSKLELQQQRIEYLETLFRK